MADYTWEQSFLTLFDRCVARYQRGDADFTGYYTPEDLSFLTSIGYKPRELFDFVEDLVDGGEPSRESALLIAAVRRDYFLHVQQGTPSPKEMLENALPARDAELGGILWLPRIIQKAQNKLRGENCPDIMYCCGGDRRFLREYDIHPADFLRVVWAARDDTDEILAFVRSHSH
jgi:hypothetical protein